MGNSGKGMTECKEKPLQVCRRTIVRLVCVCVCVKVIKSNVSFYTTLFHYALYDHQRDFTR